MNSLSVETEQLQLALEAAGMGIWDWNILTEKITWSSGHEQLFGLEIGSFDGTYATFAACIHPDDRASVAEMLNIARQEQHPYQQEMRVMWSDGSMHWIESKGRFFYDANGQAVRMLGTVLDISDRKRMELALRDSENHLRAIIAAEPECVKLVASDGTLLNMNAAGLAMIEVQNPDAAIGQSVYALVTPEHRAAFQAFNESVCNEGRSGKLEFEIVGAQGTRRWMETHAVPLQNEVNKTLVQLAVTRDITERKQVEKNLRSRVHQQAAVAKLGQLALADSNLDTLMDEAVVLVAQSLEVEYCKVLELLPDGNAVLLRAGVGWQPGLVGEATVSCDLDSQAGYTLFSHEPVIVEDLRTEKRFSGPPLLHEHQVVSGLSTIVPGKNGSYGVLGAHTTKQRQFTQDDIYFLQAVANVLAEAIARQSAEQVLRSSLQELANLKFALDESSIVAITDHQGIITYANDNFCTISQYSRAELIGQNHRIINSHYHPKTFFTQMWATISQGQVWQGEIKNRAKDGTFYWVDTTIVPLLDEQKKPYQYIAIRSDITARKWAESQLLTAKDELEIRVAQRTAELVKVNEQLQLELDERKRAEFALERLSRHNQLILNSVGEGLCGLDMQGKISFVNPAAAIMLGYSVAELSGESIYTILPQSTANATPDSWNKLPIYESLQDGAVHQVTNQVFRRKDNSSFPVEYVSTPIREADAIIGAVITFKDITERQQIERMKDEFISVVSHELRTPLTSIHGSLGMLKSGLLDPSSERGKRLLEIAVDSSDRLVRLINDILDIERIESGKVQMAKQACNAADLMAEAANVMQPIAQKFGVNLSVASTSVELWADSDRIIQTLTNLLSNALKFSHPGSTVWLTAEIQTDKLLFQVKDRGRGIPQGKLETIFERFQQVDVSDSRDREGTGLGLAICRSIVQQHDGQIWAESTLGEGSIFSFTLPIQQEIALKNLERPLILVCDDDAATRTTLQTMLQQQNYSVITVSSGQEAVEQAARQQPNAIILDLVMPGVNGWEVMADLKQHAATKDIPIVVCSVCSPDPNFSHQDFVDWVVKPLDEALLLQSIEQVLAQSDRSLVRILLVEDDLDLAQLLITLFEERGIKIFLAQTGREAIHLSQQINPDLLILDLVLPDGNGFDVAMWLSQHNYLHRLPLVVYSAKELDEFERDRLKLGQTEFLTKGRISTQELEQRVIKLLQGITQKKMQDDGDGETSFDS